MLGHPAVDSVWPWMAAVTIYGLGKTFYWPTLLGVISERFPKGGALALGISGGVGMIGAGILGGPGIGYKQDYFAVQKLEQTPEGLATYDRYMAVNDKGEPDKKGFPYVTDFFPNEVPAVAGIDNAKFKVFEDYAANLKQVEAADESGKRSDADGRQRASRAWKRTSTRSIRRPRTGRKPPKIVMTTLRVRSRHSAARKARREDGRAEARGEP